jgi:hypothetical protein
MNIVILSPHFPPNYFLFCYHLNNLGANVLGLADERYDLLRQELKTSMKEYYRVGNMHNYDELLRALGYFTHKYGKIDRIDSHNEYWLETEANLRTDFNITGIKNDTITTIKRKSIMKQMFVKAGLSVPQGKVVYTYKDAKKLTDEIGFPVVAKPDTGVGASRTYKISNYSELKKFFSQKPPIEYIIEQFVDGIICTFDGLVDRDGNVVFYTSHTYSQGVMETVNDDSLIYYYSLRSIPPDLEDAGLRIVQIFDVRERFFHFEFFRQKSDNQLVPLEVNMRPPGGLTTDMFNYANDIDIYYEWSHVIIHNRFTAKYNRDYHCSYAGRKYNRKYVFSHEQILNMFREFIVHHEPVSGVFSAALGDYGYLYRTTDLDLVHEIAYQIHKLA